MGPVGVEDHADLVARVETQGGRGFRPDYLVADLQVVDDLVAQRLP